MRIALTPADIVALAERVRVEGINHVAFSLGTTYPTLRRALDGQPIQDSTYLRMIQNADRQVDPPRRVERGELSADEVATIDRAIRWTSRIHVAGLLGVTPPTIDRARYSGHRFSSETLINIRERLPLLVEIAPPPPPPPPPTEADAANPVCPHCDGRTFAESLVRWLGSTENRRICRALLRQAGRRKPKDSKHL